MNGSHKRRMLTTMRGGMPDKIPFAPRLDLWFTAHKHRGTLPAAYQDCRHWEDVSRKHGWAFAKTVPEYNEYPEEALLDRTLGFYRIPSHQGFIPHLPKDVERRVTKVGDQVQVEYITPKGVVRGAYTYTDQMRRSGVSIPWISSHALKGPEDYPPLSYLFENIEVERDYQSYSDWEATLGEDGYAVQYALTAGSPMHHIMKILTDGTQFYFHQRDYPRQMQALAESIGVYFRKIFKVIAEGPGEIAFIGANYDDTITYPPFFRDHILPWLQEAADMLHARGKLMMCHPDGENRGLMEYLWESGMDVADSVCPAPMTKVSLEEYYARWSKRITIQGGIPSNLLLEASASEEEFESFLDYVFKVVPPGNRLILGVVDIVPPDVVMDRLLRIEERVEKQGRLPLEAGSFRPVAGPAAPAEPAPVEAKKPEDSRFERIRADLLGGLDDQIKDHIRQLLDQGVNAGEILNRGLLSVMEEIGLQFKKGDLFVPEVLLAARAMNAGLTVLDPHLSAGGQRARGKVLIGTVHGDLHDIGKNMVMIMLRGIGFEVVDLGINLPVAEFVKKVAEEKPDILGMSALLTTTMPQMKAVIEALGKAGLRDKVKVMIGGAPVNSTFARRIGADGYAADAGEAVEIAKGLLATK